MASLEEIIAELQAKPDKINTPELEAVFAQFGEQYFADAEFFNLYKQALILLHTFITQSAVVEAPALADFPVPGVSGKLYLATGTNRLYRWSGSSYTLVIASSTIADATAVLKGIIQLAGDLGGTAAEPKVLKLGSVVPVGTTQNRAVTVQPNGALQSNVMFESEIFDETTTGYSTLASINSVYPSVVGGVLVRPQGLTVYCYFMANPTIYKKCGDSDFYWLKIDHTGVHRLL